MHSHTDRQGHSWIGSVNIVLLIQCFETSDGNFLEDRRQVSHKLTFFTDKSNCLISPATPMVMLRALALKLLLWVSLKIKKNAVLGIWIH